MDLSGPRYAGAAAIKPRSAALLVAALLGSFILGLLRFDSFQVGAYVDDAQYVVLAESLASGHGYRLINFPDAPHEQIFPPGWPLLLAPLAALFPGDYMPLKLLAFGLWLATIPVVMFLFRERLPQAHLAALIVLTALNPELIGMSTMVMSEAAFLFFSLITLYLFERWETDRPDAPRWPLFAAFTGSALLTQSIRTVGIALPLALVVCLLLRRRRRHAVTLALAFGVGLLPQLWFNLHVSGAVLPPGYQHQVLEGSIGVKLTHAATNAQAYVGSILPHVLIPVFGPSTTAAADKIGAGMLLQSVQGVVSLLVAMGFLLSVRERRAGELYVLFYTGAVLAFSRSGIANAQARFLLPMVPLLYFYLLRAWMWVSARLLAWKGWNIRPVTLVMGTLLTVLLVARNLRDASSPVRQRITDLSAGTSWVRAMTAPDAIVMSRHPTPAYLHARRRSVSYPPSAQDIESYARVHGVTHVIVSPPLQTPRTTALGEYVETELLPLLESRHERFELVYADETNNVRVYAYLGDQRSR